MKKIYDAPEVHLHCVTLLNMIALSKVDGDADPEGEVFSRRRYRRTVWDEDEDEY